MMKNRQLHTIILPLCTLLLFSCTQDTISPASDSENEIRFQTGTTTRGLIDNLAVGSEICLYGYRDGTPLAQGSNLADGTSKALEGKTLRSSGDSWAVYNGNTRLTYFWEGDGNYKFFGWLTKDGTGTTGLQAPTTNFTTTYTNTEVKPYTLEVAGTLDKDYNQFDFLYSNVVNRTLPEGGKGAVPVNMKHLFTAFSIGIENLSEKDITIKEVTLRHIKTQGSATINYSDDNSVGNGKVTYNLSEQKPPATSFLSYSELTGGYVVEAGGDLEHNIFVPGTTAENKYYLVWPQTLPEISFSKEEEEEEAEDEEFTLVMKYTVEGDDAVITKRMKIPSSSLNWEAGMLYSYNVQIADKIVTLNYTIQEWDYIDSDVDFKNGTVTVASPIDWENGETNADGTFEKNTCRVDYDSHKVFVEGIKPVEATFGFSTPKGGQWYVSLVGDVDAFEIENNLGPIDGNLHRIMIKPKILSPERDYSVKLQFVVMTANGDTHLADLVQTQGHGEIYSIVLQKAN